MRRRLRPGRDCRFIDDDYCSFQIVNSIGNVFNRNTHPKQRLRILKAQIDALNSVPSGYPFEIVVSDDNSDDATIEYLFSAYRSGAINMLLLSNTRKLGNGFTKNLAMSVLDCARTSRSDLSREGSPYGQTGDRSFSPKYVALSENDVIPLRRNWLRDMVDLLEHNPDIGFLNSIVDAFDEQEMHKVLRRASYRDFELEYRRQLPGSLFVTKSVYLEAIGNHTVWHLDLTGRDEGYSYLTELPEEYMLARYNGAWDEELSLRFANAGLYGVNVLPAMMEHRKLPRINPVDIIRDKVGRATKKYGLR